MQQHIDKVRADLDAYTITTKEELDQFKQKFTSRKGVIAALLKELKNLPDEERKEIGQQLNAFKAAALHKLKLSTQHLIREQTQVTDSAEAPDPTLPPRVMTGAVHVLTATQKRLLQIFTSMGFGIAEGPDIEDQWHNFTALNFPPHHPARAMHDTFFLARDPDVLLRTHTSSVQVRVLERQGPPVRVVSVGKVFRKETISARAHCTFHQVEGLYVDQGVSFLALKETVGHFLRTLFGNNTAIRLRPSYFPFTEPSAEVDIRCCLCQAKGCSLCKYTGWVEIAGAGMVDPQVLINCGVDPQLYTGFAFGLGVERIAMLLHRIQDLRLFTTNDLRFLQQFASCS